MNVMMLLDFSVVIVGLGLLWQAGDYVVHYTIEIANKYNVSTFFLGFIVLAIAADIPELAIAFTSAIQGASEVSVGDIIGANFTDVALVVGSTLLLAGNKITVKKSDTQKLLCMLSLTAIVMLIVFCLGSINRWHGLMLIGIYALSIIWLWKTRDSHDIMGHDVAPVAQGQNPATASMPILLFKLLLSFIVVTLSSGMIVHFAVSLATKLQVPLEIIGATILGVGTSLPELALSLNALRRGDYGLALGPTLGTVLGQTTFILGTLAVLSDKPVNLTGLDWAFWFMFAAFGVIAYGLVRGERMGRGTGAVLISLFAAYLSYQARLGL